MNRSALTVVSVTILLLFCGVLYPAPAHPPEGLPSAAIHDSSTRSNMDVIRHDEGFNRESCEIRCRSIYGIPPYGEEQWSGGGGTGGSRYLIIAHCIEQCNKRFWKEFDAKMRELDRPQSR
ncbi:MAG: hypothetical protein ACLP5H_27705 [Desulfomonilaceae bacterium]